MFRDGEHSNDRLVAWQLGGEGAEELDGSLVVAAIERRSSIEQRDLKDCQALLSQPFLFGRVPVGSSMPEPDDRLWKIAHGEIGNCPIVG